MRALLCPASLKGVLTAREAAAALGRGARERRSRCGRVPDRRRGRRHCGCASLCARRRVARRDRVRPARTTGLRAVAPPRRRSCGVEAAAAIGLPLLRRTSVTRSSHRAEDWVSSCSPLFARSRARCSSASAGARRWTAERACARSCASSRSGRPFSATCARRSPTPRGSSARRRVHRRRASPHLERRLAGMEELQPYAGLAGAGAAGGLGAAFAALGAELVRCAGGPRPRRLRRAPSRVRARGDGRRSGRRDDGPRKGAGGRRRALRCGGVRCVVFGGRVVRTLDGVETVSLSGDPAAAEDDLEELARRLLG